MEGKAGQPVWESPVRQRCCGWPTPVKLHNVFPSAWTRECPEEKQTSVFPVSFFYSSIMNLHSLSNVSLLEPALAARWKQRINFANVRSLSEGFSGASCCCFPLVGETATSSQAARKMRKLLLSIWKRAFVQSRVFAMSTRACRELPSGTRL